MPHSSGGGSHSGGSHGGSHHSSSGGSSTNRTRSTTYFDGARHYVYYKNKKPVHYYSDIKITNEYIKKRKIKWNIIKFILIAFYAIFFISMFFTMVHVTPHKLSRECADPNRINDMSLIIPDTDEMQIMEQLDEFREKTGISVTILTIHDSDWGYFVTLEDYAYDYYLTHLSDEKNWLIVYSEPDEYSEFNDWKWEGMQGDDTDPILTTSSTDKFNSEMQKNITKDGFAKAVAETFDYYNDIVMEESFSLVNLIILTVAIAVHGGLFISIFWLFFGSSIKIDEKSIELANPQYTYIEDTCSFCGGLYIHGIHTSCPHCGGELAPLDRPIIIQ